MKKIFIITLLITLISVLSGCVYIETDYTNTLYVYNDSRYPVHDFYIEADDGWRAYPKNGRISSGDYSKIRDIPTDYYRISIYLGEFERYESNYTKIYCDTEYHIKNQARNDYFINRSITEADVSVVSSDTTSLTLIDNNGNELKLMKQYQI